MNRVEKDIKEILQHKELFIHLKEKTILITGATGMIGSMLVKTLHEANFQYEMDINILAFIRNSKKAEKIFGGLDEYEDVSFIDQYNTQCDYIIHTISPTKSKYFINNPVETIKSSVVSTMDVLEVAKKNNAVLVYLSSMEQYGIPYKAHEVMTEDKIGIIDHLNVRSSYSESKRLCECMCVSYADEYNVDVKIARLAQTYGAGTPIDDNRMPMQFARAVLNHNDIVLHTEGKSISNSVYLSDAIYGLFVILRYGVKGEAYNICNDSDTRSVKEIAELVSRNVADGTISVKIELSRENLGYAPDSTIYLNSQKLCNLGWRPQVQMQEGYSRLVDYLNSR